MAVHGVTPVMFGGADGGTSGTNPLKLIIAIDKTSVKSKRCIITSMPTRTVQKLWFDSSIQKPHHSDYFHTTKEVKLWHTLPPRSRKSPATATPPVAHGEDVAPISIEEGCLSGFDPGTLPKDRSINFTLLINKIWTVFKIHNIRFSLRKTEREVKTMAYTTPTIEKLATYSDVTRGGPRGYFRDWHHGRLIWL